MNRIVARGALLLAATIWGLSFLVVKDALREIGVFHLLSLRFFLATLLLVPFSRLSIRNILKDTRVFRVGAVLFLAFAFQTVGLKSTTPSRSAFLTALCIVFVPIIEWAWMRRAVPICKVAAVAVATAGLVLLYLPSLGGSAFALGDLLSLLCGLFFGLHFVVAEEALRNTPPTAIVALQSIVVMLMASPSVLFQFPDLAKLSAGAIGAIVFTGVLASGVAYWLQLFAQQRMSAVEAALILALEPVIASVASVLAGAEKVSVALISGGVLMIVAALLTEVNIPKRSRQVDWE